MATERVIDEQYTDFSEVQEGDMVLYSVPNDYVEEGTVSDEIHYGRVTDRLEFEDEEDELRVKSGGYVNIKEEHFAVIVERQA
jgi:hypothetical protein